jgi:hypothetical protein
MKLTALWIDVDPEESNSQLKPASKKKSSTTSKAQKAREASVVSAPIPTPTPTPVSPDEEVKVEAASIAKPKASKGKRKAKDLEAEDTTQASPLQPQSSSQSQSQSQSQTSTQSSSTQLSAPLNSPPHQPNQSNQPKAQSQSLPMLISHSNSQSQSPLSSSQSQPLKARVKVETKSPAKIIEPGTPIAKNSMPLAYTSPTFTPVSSSLLFPSPRVNPLSPSRFGSLDGITVFMESPRLTPSAHSALWLSQLATPTPSTRAQWSDSEGSRSVDSDAADERENMFMHDEPSTPANTQANGPARPSSGVHKAMVSSGLHFVFICIYITHARRDS